MTKIMNSKKKIIALILAMVLLAAIPLMTASAVGENYKDVDIDDVFNYRNSKGNIFLYKCPVCITGNVYRTDTYYCPSNNATRLGVCSVYFVFCGMYGSGCSAPDIAYYAPHVRYSPSSHKCAGCSCDTHF